MSKKPKTRKCPKTGQTQYECVDCGKWEYDVTTKGFCQVCWSLLNALI